MPKAKRGRPSAYTEELAKKICARLAQGRTLRDVCRDKDMPDESTVRQWAAENYQGFYPHYTHAREVGYQAMADEAIAIADDISRDYKPRKARDGSVEMVVDQEHVNRSRLRVDTRKWLLSKALPKIYGDRVTTEVSGPNGGPIQTEDISPTDAGRRILFALKQLARAAQSEPSDKG